MKKLVAFCFALLLFCPLYAQNKASIEFKKTVHDFGSIKERDGMVTCTFSFTNTGSVPLVINNVAASCGCTTPEWTKAPVAPGKTGIIKATYNPEGRPYPFDKTITVSSNATETILHIKGNVEGKVLTIEEQYPLAIGALRLKSNTIALARITSTATKTETLDVINNSSSPLVISFEKVPAHIRLEADPISLGAKQKGVIRCTYLAAAKKDFGPVSDIITISTGKNKGTIEVQATIEEDFSKMSQSDIEKAPLAFIKNASADFGSIKKGQQYSASYEITNNGKSDFVIRKMTPDCKCIQITSNPQTIKPGQTGTIKVQLNTGSESAGLKFYTIVLATNAPTQPLLNLFLSGSVL